MLVFLLVFRVIVVSGSSMYSTLLDGDYLLLLSNVFYHEPENGDIVVISKESFDDGKPIVKRVIATEGQWVDIDFEAGVVYVNGTALDEPYTNTPTNLYEGVDFPLMVEENCIFVMGDNRNESKDSRSFEIGLIDKREILGRAIFLFLPGVDPLSAEMNFKRIGALS
jgi:signal peptidase I